MDWLQFCAEIVKALAWPGVVVFIFVYLRKPLTGLVPLLEELKYKDFVLKFRAGISEVKSEVRALPQSAEPTPQLSGSLDALRGTLYSVALLSPTAAVVQAWAELETKLMERAFNLGIATTKDANRGNSRLGHAMLEAGVFSPVDFRIFHKLRELRNVAAHKADAGLQEKDARDYVDLVLVLLGKTTGCVGA